MRISNLKPAVVLLFLAVFLSTLDARAHQSSKSYLLLEVTNGEIAGRWEIAMMDLVRAQGEAAFAAALTNSAPVDPKTEMEKAGVLSRLKLKADNAPVEVTPVEYSIAMFPDGAFGVMRFKGKTSANPRELEVEYRLFFDIDPSHAGLMGLMIGKKTTSAVFDASHQTQRFKLRELSAGEKFFDFVRLGVWHIWTGFDHVLFLLALLFPSVLRWKAGKWEISANFRDSFFNVLKIVTAFTLAHSVTLSLAAFKVIQLNSRFVETAIALSVMFAALNNIFAVLPDFGWVIAFCFGLVHGFGFANVLGALGLTRGTLAAPLVGFNVGVELGQLAIVAIFLPFAFKFRPTRFYRFGILRLGSLVITALAGIWAWERIFDKKLSPF